jgi:cytochrome c oxidase subunit 2
MTAVAALLAGLLWGEASAEDANRGEVLFENCVACHGATGAGNEKLGAPSIAGLPKWYVEEQLRKFQTGARGAHPEDIEGLRMRPMSMTVLGDANLSAVAAYVASLPVTRSGTPVAGGDAEAGKNAYMVCVACHGQAGEGNETLRAPPLVQISDWYALRQLKKFKAGVRGTNPADTSGATMRPMSLTLADEQAMKNVLAYIRTLSK